MNAILIIYGWFNYLIISYLFPDAEKLFSHTKSKMHAINSWYSVFYKIPPKGKSVFGGQAGDYIFAKKSIKSAKTHFF